jgi:hypothetical protein
MVGTAAAYNTGWGKRRRAYAERISNSEVLCRKKTRTSALDGLLCMLRRKDFVPDEIHAETIRELEKIVTTSSGSKINDYDFWTKDDGKQEDKLYLRSLRQIIKGILPDLRIPKSPVSWVLISRKG